MLPVSHVGDNPRRWLFFAVGAILFVVRIQYLRAFCLVTYGLGIALLNNLVRFLTPKVNPDTERLRATLLQPSDDAERERAPLTERNLDSPSERVPWTEPSRFTSFCRWHKVRKPQHLPEYPCWVSSQKMLLGAFGMTFFRVFDIPAFWPILLAYFVVLTVLVIWQTWRKRRRIFGRRSWVL